MNSDKFNILFICTGNSCRSPIAEGLMRVKLPPELKEKVIVRSAGTLGLEGNPATELAIAVASDKGADISEHRSHGLSDCLVKDSDIIFAMAPEHREFVEREYPEARENVFLLKSFGRNPEEKYYDSIEDPIGGSLRVYQECCDIIDSELDRIMPRLKSLIEEKLKQAND
jgi:protein-tyrosine phosphatase